VGDQLSNRAINWLRLGTSNLRQMLATDLFHRVRAHIQATSDGLVTEALKEEAQSPLFPRGHPFAATPKVGSRILSAVAPERWPIETASACPSSRLGKAVLRDAKDGFLRAAIPTHGRSREEKWPAACFQPSHSERTPAGRSARLR
jgi:hypothetical protein